MGRARRRFWWKARMNANDVGGFAISLALAQTQPEMSATQPSTGTPVGPAPAGPRVPGAAATPGATTTQQQSIAPGTGVPSAGGLTSRELLDFLRQLRGVRLAGLDVDEVAPPLDVGQVTSLAALKFIFEYIGMVKLGTTA